MPNDVWQMAHAPARRVVALLALAVFVNYIDRGNLSVAAPVLKDQLHFGNVQMGLLLSAFFWSYVPAQLLAGWAVQRFDARWVMAGGLALWSLATVLTGFANGFFVLLALRFALGFGQSVTFPGNSHVLAQFPDEAWRSRANALVICCSPWAQAFGTLVGGLLVVQWGWRALFLIGGCASLLWLLPWFAQRLPLAAAGSRSAPPSVAQLLRCRALWGASLGQFGFNYNLYFTLTWLPLYLVKAHGFSLTQMATVGAVVFAFYGLSSLATGVVTGRCIAAGVAVGSVRRVFAVAGCLGLALSMAWCATAGAAAAVALLLVSSVCKGACGAVNFAIAQTLAGPRGAGRWVGIQNCLGNVAGIVAPALTGFIVEYSGNFQWAFAAAALAAVVGAIGYGLVIPTIAPIDWSPFSAAAQPASARSLATTTPLPRN